MFACRSRASTKSEVESSTIAVFSRGEPHAAHLRRPRCADRVRELVDRPALLDERDGAGARRSRRARSAVASAVRQTTAAPEAAITARVAAAPSSPGSR